MADNQKYYYMRLKENFFDSPELKTLESMRGGYKYSNILLKLYLLSLRGEGRLTFRDNIPYDVDMLSRLIGFSKTEIENALKIFQKFELIDILDTGTIYMLDIQAYIGESTTEADRKRKYRARIESEKSGQMSRHLSDKYPPEIEKEIEKEIDNTYTQRTSNGQPVDGIGKDRIGKDRIGKDNNPYAHSHEHFESFWNAYPKKKDKQNALKAFKKINPDEALLSTMLEAIKQQSNTSQWQRDGGQYIPYPASWLNGKRWEDEQDKPIKSSSSKPDYYDASRYENVVEEMRHIMEV